MLIYQYSGELDGFLSAVFRIYQEKTVPDLLTDGELCESPLFSDLITVHPEEEKALRVEKGIYARLGISGLHQLSYAYASSDPERNRKLLYWILSVFKYGNDVQKRHHDPNVTECCDMTAKVTTEIHRMLGFLRFSQSRGGIYCAEFSPDNNVLPFIMHHFVHRFGDQPFLILDVKRNLCGIYNCEEWKIVTPDKKISVLLSEREQVFQDLWKTYFRSVSVASRENRKLQDSYLPRRYRAFLTEFQTLD